MRITPMTDTEYDEWIESMTRYLCGVNCGSAVDIILAYVKKPDISRHQFDRLVSSLVEYQKELCERRAFNAK